MRSILNRHPQVHITKETHYFDDLRPRLSNNSESHPLAVDYFRAIHHTHYGVAGDPDQAGVTHTELLTRAQRIGSGPDAVFEAYCRFGAEQANRVVWGEKTPRHLFQVDQILTAYPSAKIIIMLRDVRAVAASYRDWVKVENTPGKDRQPTTVEQKRILRSYSPTIIALLWRSAVSTALSQAAKHGASRVRVVRFEDLIKVSEALVPGLVAWLGLNMTPEMLEIDVINSSYVEPGTSLGFDKEIISRWRSKLSDAEKAHIQWVAGSAMKDVGYRREDVAIDLKFSFGEIAWLPLNLMRAILANRSRIGSLTAYISVRVKGLLRPRISNITT